MGLLHIILNDLREAWKAVTDIDFRIESMDTKPQLVNVPAPNEAVVAIGVEIHVAEAIGMRNIALPSIVITIMRQRFEQQWSVPKTQPNDTEQSRLLGILREASLTLEARLEGLGLSVENLLSLSEGHLVIFDQPVGSLVSLLVNGREQYYGQIVSSGGKRAFAVAQIRKKNLRNYQPRPHIRVCRNWRKLSQ